MARHELDDRVPFDAARAVIKIEADGLARRHGLDSARVLRILETTAQDYYGNPLPDAGAAADTLEHGLSFYPSLDDALKYLPPDTALALLETEDLYRLATRLNVTQYLTSDHAPLYSLDELADLTEAFLSHLQRNREHVLTTGHPLTDFSSCSWLDWHLTKLYYVKLPLRVHKTRNRQGQFVNAYVWPDKAAESLRLPQPPQGIHIVGARRGYMWSPDGTAYTNDGMAVRPCPYEDAALIEDLDPEDAARLVAGRPKIFDLKIRILQRLLTALHQRNTRTLWSDCQQLLTDTLTTEEAEFYLRMDRFYLGFDVRTGEMVDAATELLAGGFTDLLEIIGHYEGELTVGALARTRENLSLLPHGLRLSSYYEAVGERWRGDLDAALDLFLGLDAQAQTFWTSYRSRVYEALENEFYEEVVVRTRVKRKFVGTFEPQIRTFAEWQRAHLEAGSQLPALQLSEAVGPQRSEGNVFRREGQFWMIIFNHQHITLKDAKGLNYIWHLLRHPHHTFHALDLHRVAEGGQTIADRNAPRSMNQDQLDKLGLSLSRENAADAILDPQATAQYQQQLKDLQEDLAEAERNHDLERAAAIQEEMDWFRQQLVEAYGLGGRVRTFVGEPERARQMISKAISRSLKAIEHEHPALWRHLRLSLQTGTFFTYTPEIPVRWSS